MEISNKIYYNIVNWEFAFNFLDIFDEDMYSKFDLKPEIFFFKTNYLDNFIMHVVFWVI